MKRWENGSSRRLGDGASGVQLGTICQSGFCKQSTITSIRMNYKRQEKLEYSFELLQLYLHITIISVGVLVYKDFKVNCCLKPRYSPPYTVDHNGVSCKNCFGSKFRISDVVSKRSAFDISPKQYASW